MKTLEQIFKHISSKTEIIVKDLGSTRIILNIFDGEKFLNSLEENLRAKEYFYSKLTDYFGDLTAFNDPFIPEIAHIHQPEDEAETAERPHFDNVFSNILGTKLYVERKTKGVWERLPDDESQRCIRRYME